MCRVQHLGHREAPICSEFLPDPLVKLQSFNVRRGGED